MEKRFDGPGKSWNLLSVKVWEPCSHKMCFLLLLYRVIDLFSPDHIYRLSPVNFDTVTQYQPG